MLVKKNGVEKIGNEKSMNSSIYRRFLPIFLKKSVVLLTIFFNRDRSKKSKNKRKKKKEKEDGRGNK